MNELPTISQKGQGRKMARTVLDTMTVSEAARRYGCNSKTIYRRIKERRIEIRRPGRNIQVVTASADAWYESTKNRI